MFICAFHFTGSKNLRLQISRLMLGFMIPTMFLSMWISNTATTAMMVPIVDAVLKELDRDLEVDSESNSSTRYFLNITLAFFFNFHKHFLANHLIFRESNNVKQDEEMSTKSNEKSVKIHHMIFLSVAYAANCGGTGTLTGTGSNLILRGTLAELPDNPINFASW